MKKPFKFILLDIYIYKLSFKYSYHKPGEKSLSITKLPPTYPPPQTLSFKNRKIQAKLRQ